MRRSNPFVAALIPIVLLLASAWRGEAGLSNVTAVAVSNGTLMLSIGANQLNVRARLSNLLEVDFRPNGQFSAPTEMLAPGSGSSFAAQIVTNLNPIRLTTDAMVVEIDRTPCRLRVFDGTGTNLLMREPDAEGVYSDGLRLNTPPGSDLYGINGFGVWEDTSPKMTRSSGGVVEAGYQGDCGAPLVWSRNGFGVLVDSDGGQFSVSGTNLTFQYCSQTNILYFIAVGAPPDILSAFSAASGRPPMFPKWAMGFANTEWGINQAELTNIVATYRQKQIPIDHYIVDFDWKAWGQDNYGEWRWDTSKFADGPSGLLKSRLDAAGIHLSGIMKPRIHVNTVQGQYATSSKFWWPGQATYSDYFSGLSVKDLNFALPACRAWFFDHITNSFATGIRGWWNDEADQAGGGGIQFGNWQFLNMQKALYEGQRSIASQRVWSVNRNFYLGSQRYAYGMWSGDIDGGFTSLARERERMMSALNVGAVKWGMDIGGFNNGAQTTSECYARWMQFGAFVPIYRVHGQQNDQRQPWVYGATAEAAAKAAIELRYRLIPYIYSYERLTFETGIGIVRPLVYAFPQDSDVANYVEAWMFGDHLLVSPVAASGESSHSVHLPEGTWYDWARGTKYAGGRTIAYAVNSSTWTDIPLFVRAGGIIPTQPVMNYVGETMLTNLTVDAFPDWTPSEFTYYDDDGTTYAYESGSWFKQKMSSALEDSRTVFSLDAPQGSYEPALERYTIRIHGPTGTVVTAGDSNLTPFASLSAFSNSYAEGWASGTDRFGQVTYVRVQARETRSIVVSNNLVMPPTLVPAGGAFSGPVLLTLQPPASGATIRYTLNGADPDETSALYSEPFVVWSSCTVRARAFVAGRAPSDSASAAFTIDNNQLLNPGFETQGVTTNHPYYWNAGDPDLNGDVDGSAGRVSWRSHGGTWEGTIRGTWAGLGNAGTFWQERPVLSGRTYKLSAWFWADSTWSAGKQGMKIEFLTGTPTGTNYLLAVTSLVSGVGQAWTQKTMTATAPPGGQWVRAVVFAESAGANGALQFDDLSLEPVGAIPLTVVSDHGSPVPPVGTHLYGLGERITNSVDALVSAGGTQYVCSGWSMSGHDPAAGTDSTMVMAVTNGAVLRWNWTTNVLEPATIEFERASYSFSEADTAAVIRLVRSGGTNGAVQLRVKTIDGSASAPADFESIDSLVTFADGETNAAVAIALRDDLLYENDKSFTASLYSPVGSTQIGAQSNAQVNIVSDDPDRGPVSVIVQSDNGQADPPAGTNAYPFGTLLTLRLTNSVSDGGTQFVGAGWTGSGSVPQTGSGSVTPPVTLTNDSSIEWHWRTNVYFSCVAGPNGGVAGSSNGWYAAGSPVTVQALPLTNYVFVGWTGDVSAAQAQENPLALTLDAAASVRALFHPATGSNLLNNPGFEQQGASADVAAYWKAGDPDAHGDMTGTALRVNWISHEGSWQGTIRGTWSGTGTSGEFWQEIPAHPGARYRFSGWFWADDGNPWGPWAATHQYISLEFRTAAGAVLLGATNDLGLVTQTWSNHSVDADAPAGAEWVRVVIHVDGVGPDGALQFDDFRLEALDVLPQPIFTSTSPVLATSFWLWWTSIAGCSGYDLDVATNDAFRRKAVASDLFISEYGEGSSNNRYIEIFNGTGGSVDLGGYRIWGINNGGSWPESELTLSGTITNGQAYLIRSSSATATALVARASLSTTNASLAFGGDDAVGLARLVGSSYLLIDAIGASGADPGSGWGVAGVDQGTLNHTLVRKPEVKGPEASWAVASNQWIVLASDTHSNAGLHVASGLTGGDAVPGYESRHLSTRIGLTVTGLFPGVTYYVRLRATNLTALSEYSPTVSITTRSSFVVLASSFGAGTISPSGAVVVAAGSNMEFYVEAAPFHGVSDVRRNGVSFDALPATNAFWYTWTNAMNDGTLDAQFVELVTTRGTPEWWLNQYFGATNYEAVENEDTDLDGLSGWQEFVAATDPTNANSTLQLWWPVPDDPAALQFQSATGRNYRLETAAEPRAADWQVLDERAGDGAVQTLSLTNDQPSGVYRVRVIRP